MKLPLIMMVSLLQAGVLNEEDGLESLSYCLHLVELLFIENFIKVCSGCE